MLAAVLAALVIPRTTPLQRLTTRGPQWVAELFSCSWCLGFHLGWAAGLYEGQAWGSLTWGLIVSVAAGSIQLALNMIEAVTEAARAYTSKAYIEKD